MSEVWNHFKLAPNGLSVTCHHCGKFMKRSDSSTKSMWGHLNSFHKEAVGEETFQMKRKRRIYPKDPNGPPPRKRKPRRKLGEKTIKVIGPTSSSTDEEEGSSSSNATTRVSNSPQVPVFGSYQEGVQRDMMAAAHLQHMLGTHPELLMMFSPSMSAAAGMGSVAPAAALLPRPIAPKIFPGYGVEKAFMASSPIPVASMAPTAAIPTVGGEADLEVKQEILTKTPTQPYVKRKRSRASPGATAPIVVAFPSGTAKVASKVSSSCTAATLDIKPKEEILCKAESGSSPLVHNNGYNSNSSAATAFLLNAAGVFDPIMGDANLLNALDPTTLMAFMGELLKESEKFSNNNSTAPKSLPPTPQSSTAEQQQQQKVGGPSTNFADVASLACNSMPHSNTPRSPPQTAAANVFDPSTLPSNVPLKSQPNKLGAANEKTTETKKSTEQLTERNGVEGLDETTGLQEEHMPNGLLPSNQRSAKGIKVVEDDHNQPPFNISDPLGLYALHQIAMELQLTYSSHGRRGIPEYCFESNRTAERSGARGRMITLTENGQEVQICEKVNGYATLSETWAKTDLTQLVWAIRGKCQKSLCSK